jgi:hypothetical protein
MFRPKFVSIIGKLKHIIELDMVAVLFLLNVRELVGAKQSFFREIIQGSHRTATLRSKKVLLGKK